MKDPHAKYTYEYELVRCTGRGVEEIPGYWPTHVAIYRRQIKSDADGYQHTQWLLDIPMSEVQFSAPEKQPPATSAELCERLQTVPDNYTAHVSNTQRYKMLGNGWTVDVIAHIFNSIESANEN